MVQRTKLKINSKNKSYDVFDSPLFKLTSKKRLVKILRMSLDDLIKLKNSEGNYSIFEQRSKKGKIRKIQKPLKQLDIIHTRIASLLARIKVPDYLHSGKKGHSNISNASVHKNSQKMLTTDIKSFFPSTSRKIVFSYFYTVMKMSADVADLLSYICTCNGHLPTGSRISMPLAFLANIRMFEELASLCSRLNVTMSVYVDDLTFSGANVNKLFMSSVKKIISKHGHEMHPTKTKLYNSDSPKLVTGVIVHNEELKVRNEQHYLMTQELNLWKIIKDEKNAKYTQITNRLIGRLYSMGVVDEKYKAKVLTVRSATSD